ncbi:DNA-directed RNA polymerase subunit omega [Leucothrix arctica]|uniref:DNA-directed RNA polymerase subunit omega n=1 Tax=Leucothrix arctica TaxID=1481894 RepID=A0A317CDA1_9GAMM|nr:DNA-directed RNA polymerase subunit omega [Leucothrix arctica]PWQ94290.1 DNA-directed RNA polymerase subunit omega [Leucothrix arctica]
MARVTVEDCIKHFDSNYDLVLQASKRARAIAEGAEPLVERDNDKPTVLALREIADEVVPKEDPAAEAAKLDQDPFEISIEA